MSEISSKLLRIGSNVRQDLITLEVIQALREKDVRPLLLKGPTLQFLYEGDLPRTYIDSDLLVQPDSVQSAEQVLFELGFEPVVPILPHDRPWVAREWQRARDKAVVEIHRSFEGIGVAPNRAWTILSGQAAHLDLRGERIEGLSLAGRALIAALHALEHRFNGDKPLEDLERALRKIERGVWEQAAVLARKLDALPAFAGGLSKTPASSRLLEALNLEEVPSIEVAIRQAETPRMTSAVHWFMTSPTSPEKILLVIRKVFPQRAYIRSWFPRAKTSWPWLLIAYLWRPIWLLGKAVPAFIAWRRVKRETHDLAQSRNADGRT